MQKPTWNLDFICVGVGLNFMFIYTALLMVNWEHHMQSMNPLWSALEKTTSWRCTWLPVMSQYDIIYALRRYPDGVVFDFCGCLSIGLLLCSVCYEKFRCWLCTLGLQCIQPSDHFIFLSNTDSFYGALAYSTFVCCQMSEKWSKEVLINNDIHSFSTHMVSRLHDTPCLARKYTLWFILLTQHRMISIHGILYLDSISYYAYYHVALSVLRPSQLRPADRSVSDVCSNLRFRPGFLNLGICIISQELGY